MLQQLYKSHNKFCNILKKMGCCNDVVEDFVQDMYIKIHVYSQTKEIKNIDVLAYFILRNLYFDYYRKKTNNNISKLQYNINNSCYIYSDSNDLSKDISKARHSHKRTDPLDRSIDCDTLYGENVEQEQFNLDEEIIKSDNATMLETILNDPLILNWYDKKILLEHYKEGVSIRKIGRDTEIGFPSIYNTVKKAKEQIKIAFNEKQRTRGHHRKDS